MKKILYLLLFLISYSSTQAQSTAITLLKDINPSSGSNAGTRNYTSYNGKFYFSADDGVNGGELWVSDGTTPGTKMLKDIYPGPNGSFPQYLVVCNGKLFFTATDLAHGNEIWISDGTTAGTQLLKDIKYGYNDSEPGELTVMNNNVYFSADDSVHAIEPWISDGTEAGTQLLADINQDPDYQNSSPSYFYAFNNKIYFQANDQLNGTELWRSDGTTAGTVLVKDINSTQIGAGSEPRSFCAFKGKLYFKADEGNSDGEGELWATDGTMEGTVLVKKIRPTGNAYTDHLIAVNGSLVFTASEGINGTELWVSDGTTAGTHLLKDINPGSASSYGDLFTLFKNKVYFEADNGTNGSEVWVTDGTVAGTLLLTDINPNGNADPAYFTPMGNRLYFRAISENVGTQLWFTDGTAAGTASLAPANAKESALDCANSLFAMDSTTLYFNADYDIHSCEVWKYSVANPTGLFDNEIHNTKEVVVYPNPSKGSFSVKTSLTLNERIAVYNTLGHLMIDQAIQGEVSTLDGEPLPNGIYFIVVTQNGQQVYQQKIIKQ